MRKNQHHLVLTAFSVTLFLLVGCKQQTDKKVLRLAHGLDTNHPVHQAMVYMAERLEKQSEGQLTMKIYPSAQLGAERECLELLQIGSLDMTKVSSAVMENFVEEYQVLSIPYLFKSTAHSHRFFDSPIGDSLLNKGTSQRLKGLCFYDAGARSFYSKEKPIEKPSDLKGKKVRVQKSYTSFEMIRQLGGSPTPISWGELYTALQQGVVDVAENNPPSFYLSKHYEVCNFFSLNEHAIIPDVLLVGQHTWERLSQQEQNWLMKAAKESSVYQRKLWKESEEKSLQAVIDAGVEVTRPDKSLFEEDVQSIKQSFKSNKNITNFIEGIKSLEQ